MDSVSHDIGSNFNRQPWRNDMGLELVVFATVFTLIVLLTGGPGNGV